MTDRPQTEAESPTSEIGEDVFEAEIGDESLDAGSETVDIGIDLPADDSAAVPVLIDELMSARQEAGGYLDNLQRLAAEYDNFRKRALRDRDDTLTRASQRLVEELLPVLDSFDQAFTHEAQSRSEEKLLAGVHSTYHQLMDVLAKEGLEPIEGEGEAFDPEVHEAVMGQTGDGHPVVAKVLRRGYKLTGRVIRPAMVEVGEEG